MKKNLLICAVALVIFGCGSKSSNPTPTKPDYKKLIIGKWATEHDTIREYTNDKLTRTYVVNTTGNYMEFKADGTGSEGWSKLIFPYTYAITDKVLNIKKAAIKDGSAEYPATEFSWEIKELTSNHLFVYYENIDTDSKGNVYKEIEHDHYSK
jgi:hypothetical protein